MARPSSPCRFHAPVGMVLAILVSWAPGPAMAAAPPWVDDCATIGGWQFGILDQVWGEASTPPEVAERMVRVSRRLADPATGEPVVHVRPGEPGLVLCGGDVIETWYDAQAVIRRTSRDADLPIGLVLPEGGAVLLLDLRIHQVRGAASYFLFDERPREEVFDLQVYIERSGTLLSQARSLFRVEVEDNVGQATRIAVSGENEGPLPAPVEGHGVLVETMESGDAGRWVGGGEVVRVGSDWLEPVGSVMIAADQARLAGTMQRVRILVEEIRASRPVPPEPQDEVSPCDAVPADDAAKDAAPDSAEVASTPFPILARHPGPPLWGGVVAEYEYGLKIGAEAGLNIPWFIRWGLRVLYSPSPGEDPMASAVGWHFDVLDGLTDRSVDLSGCAWLEPRRSLAPRIVRGPYLGIEYGASHRTYHWQGAELDIGSPWFPFVAWNLRLPIQPTARLGLPLIRRISIEPYFREQIDFRTLGFVDASSGLPAYEVPQPSFAAGLYLGMGTPYHPYPPRRIDRALE